VALLEAVVRRDPLNVATRASLGRNQLEAGRYDAAIASCRTVLSLGGRGGNHHMLGRALLRKGDAAGALAEMEQEKSELWRMLGLPMAYHALGRAAESDAALAALIAKWEKTASYGIAYVCAFRGDADKAFEWLDQAVQSHNPGLSEIVREKLSTTSAPTRAGCPSCARSAKRPSNSSRSSSK